MATKLETMRRFGIPTLAVKLVLMPAVRKDARGTLHLYEQLAAGQQLPAPAKRRLLCFAA